jgi:hypothetical protein
MTEPRPPREQDDPIPRLQQLYDSPFLLLLVGVLVMLVVYTGWGLVEILTLPAASLP